MRAKVAYESLNKAIDHAYAVSNWSHAVDAEVAAEMVGGLQQSDAAFEYRFTALGPEGWIAIFSLTSYDQSRPFSSAAAHVRYRNRLFLALLRKVTRSQPSSARTKTDSPLTAALNANEQNGFESKCSPMRLMLVQLICFLWREVMKLNTLVVFSVLAAGATGGVALAQTTQAASTTMANDLPNRDKEFVQAASMSSSTEIDASRLASKQSQDKDVKAFAHQMMLDHTKLAVQLKVAAPHGVTVPKDNSDTAVLDSLKGLRGADFDKVYLQKLGVEGHQKAVAAFQKEADGGQNPDLKKAAQKALPTI
jgi:predicted outer membrane protein